MSESEEKVVLVDKNGNSIGAEYKLKAHRDGLRHRAFSVMIYRKTEGSIEYLLQKRAESKYHGGGLWSNTCCSHSRPDEALSAAVHRRLKEELGLLSRAPIQELAPVLYKVTMANGLIEHEYDHVFVCEDDFDVVNANPNEASECQWVAHTSLEESLEAYPERFTPWLPIVLNQLLASFSPEMFGLSLIHI